MSVTRQIVKNAGALTAARGVTAVLTLVTTVYLGRVLEPGAFGIFNWALAYLAYFQLLPDLGLGVYGQREAARSHARVPDLVNHILPLRVGLAALALLAYLGVLAVLDKPPLFKLVVAIQGLALFAYALSLEWTFKGIERMGALAIRNVLVASLTLGAVLLFVRESHQVTMAAAATVLGALGGSLWLLLTYRNLIGPLQPRIDRAEWRRMLIPALPIGAVHFLASINANLDQLMLGLIRTEQEVGWYAAAYRLLLAAAIPSQIILQAFLPSLSASLGDRAAMRARARAFAAALFAFGLPTAAGCILFAPDLIGLFGAHYAPAVPAFLILSVHAVLLYANVALGNPLIAWDRQKYYMYALIGGAASNVLLNVLLIPRYGIVGAATATLAAELITLVSTAFFHYREAGQLYGGAFLRAAGATLLATAGTVAAQASLGLSFVPAALTFGVLYAAAAALTGLVDVHRLLSLIRRRSL